MNNSRKSRSFPSQVCDTWADLLAFTPEEQLSPADLAAFIEHVKTCPVCAALREDYRLLTTYTRRALSVTPLSDLPASVLAEMQRASSVVGGGAASSSSPTNGQGTAHAHYRAVSPLAQGGRSDAGQKLSAPQAFVVGGYQPGSPCPGELCLVRPGGGGLSFVAKDAGHAAAESYGGSHGLLVSRWQGYRGIVG